MNNQKISMICRSPSPKGKPEHYILHSFGSFGLACDQRIIRMYIFYRALVTWLGTFFSILSKKISSGFHSLPRMSKCCKGLLASKSYKRYSKMVRLWDLWIDAIRELEKKLYSRISFQIWKLGATGMWLLHKWIEKWPTPGLH